MSSVRAFIKRYPVLTFYALVFAISWGGILFLVGPGRIPGTTKEVERLVPFALLTGPFLVVAVLFALSLVSPVFLPGIVAANDRVGLLLFGLAWGLVGGGLLEELGWTGFAAGSQTR